MNGYKGKKFTKSQLVFIVEAILCSAFDSVDGQLPPCVSKEEYEKNKDGIGSYFDGIREQVGMSLSVLYAQLTGDGMASCDALSIINYDKELDLFIAKRLQDSNSECPDAHSLAICFVKECFDKLKDDYLKP